MKKIVMTIFGSRPMSYKERLEYAGKAFIEHYTGQKSIGYIEKFNNAYGFKKLEYDEKTHVTEIESPDGYHSPYSLLLLNRYFLNKKNEISTFIIENEMMEHPIEEYTYNTMSMLISFQSFLYKVFPNDIRIEFSETDEIELSAKARILSHFWNCASESECVDTEMAIGHLITKKEKKYILNVMSQVLSYEPEIRCWLCETCFEYHPERPYHIELMDKREKLSLDNADIKAGYWKMSNIKKEVERYKELKRKVGMWQKDK